MRLFFQKQYNKYAFASTLFYLIFTTNLSGQLASWYFTSSNAGSGSTGVAAGLAALGSGLNMLNLTCNGGAISCDQFYDSGDPNPTTESDAVTDNEFIVFPITALPGYDVLIQRVEFYSRYSDTGADSRAVYVDGTSIGTNTQNTTNLCQLQVVTLSDVTISAGNTKEFKIYGWGADGFSAGNIRLDNVEFFGAITLLLPIELSVFEVITLVSHAKLSWQTASELNFSHFSIEKSTDGTKFREIGVVPGSGTTNESQDYEFIDTSPSPGINYYRLRQVDFDGQFEYSKVVSVDFKGKAMLSLYPTLADSEVNLKFPEPTAEEGQLLIFDTGGRLVYQLYIEQETEELPVSIEHLSPGHYFARVQIGRQLENLRFVKQ